MILDSTFFSFGDQFYKQKFGSSMGFISSDNGLSHARIRDSIVEQYKFRDTILL